MTSVWASMCVCVCARIALFPESPGARVGKFGCIQTKRVFKTKITKVMHTYVGVRVYNG